MNATDQISDNVNAIRTNADAASVREAIASMGEELATEIDSIASQSPAASPQPAAAEVVRLDGDGDVCTLDGDKLVTESSIEDVRNKTNLFETLDDGKDKAIFDGDVYVEGLADAEHKLVKASVMDARLANTGKDIADVKAKTDKFETSDSNDNAVFKGAVYANDSTDSGDRLATMDDVDTVVNGLKEKTETLSKDANDNAAFSGDVYVGDSSDPSNKLATIKEVSDAVDGTTDRIEALEGKTDILSKDNSGNAMFTGEVYANSSKKLVTDEIVAPIQEKTDRMTLRPTNDIWFQGKVFSEYDPDIGSGPKELATLESVQALTSTVNSNRDDADAGLSAVKEKTDDISRNGGDYLFNGAVESNGRIKGATLLSEGDIIAQGDVYTQYVPDTGDKKKLATVEYADSKEADAKSFATTKDGENLAAAKEYSDTKKEEAVAEANEVLMRIVTGVDLLKQYCDRTNQSEQGVDFEWNGDVLHARALNASESSDAFYRFRNLNQGLPWPWWLVRGKTYQARVKATKTFAAEGDNVGLRFNFERSGGPNRVSILYNDGIVSVPADATDVGITVIVPKNSGYTSLDPGDPNIGRVDASIEASLYLVMTKGESPLASMEDLNYVASLAYTRNAKRLSAGDDVHNLAPGAYYCDDSDIAKLIVNSPTQTTSFMLYVVRTTGSHRTRLIAFTNTDPKSNISGIYTAAEVYNHSLATNIWGPWKRMSSRYEAVDDLTGQLPGQIMAVVGDGNVSNTVFGNGGLNTSTGALENDDRSIRSPAYPVHDSWYVIPAMNVTYRLFGWAGRTFVGCTDKLTGTRLIRDALALLNNNSIDTWKIAAEFTGDSDRNPMATDTQNALKQRLYIGRRDGAQIFGFEAGSIGKDDGANNNNSKRARTTGFIQGTDYYISPLQGTKYHLFFYDAAGTYIKSVLYRAKELLVASVAPEGAASWRFVVFRPDDAVIANGYPVLTSYYGALIQVYKANSFPYLLGARATENKSVPVSLVWGLNGIASDTGKNNTNKKRLSTPARITSLSSRIEIDPDYKYSLFYYDANGDYIGWSDWIHDNVVVADVVPDMVVKTPGAVAESAASFRIVFAADSDRFFKNTNDAVYLTLYDEESSSTDAYESDIPPHIGVLNAIRNFKQMVEVEYVAARDLPKLPSGNYAAGETVQGLIYSSARPTGGWVPTSVSMHTFMTAMRNPNSCMYAIDMTKAVSDGGFGNKNGRTYYGTVCSVAASGALNLPHGYSTYQWRFLEDMEAIELKSAYDVRLGDTIVVNENDGPTNYGHVVMVTDITRNKRGKIGTITVSEAINARWGVCSYTSYSPQLFEDTYVHDKNGNKYYIARCKKINEVPYETSPFVAVEDELGGEFVYPPVIPRKGDKSNYRLNPPTAIDGIDDYIAQTLAGFETVVVDVDEDVFAAHEYSKYSLYKDDVLVGTYDLDGSVIYPTIDGPGMYRLCLSNGDAETESDSCYFAVVSMFDGGAFSPTVTGRNVTLPNINCSDNAVPYELQFLMSNKNPGFAPGKHNGTAYIATIKKDDGGNWVNTYPLPEYQGDVSEVYPEGVYSVKLGFKTEYGVIYSEPVEVDLIALDVDESVPLTLSTDEYGNLKVEATVSGRISMRTKSTDPTSKITERDVFVAVNNGAPESVSVDSGTGEFSEIVDISSAIDPVDENAQTITLKITETVIYGEDGERSQTIDRVVEFIPLTEGNPG